MNNRPALVQHLLLLLCFVCLPMGLGCDGIFFNGPTATVHHSQTLEFLDDTSLEVESRNGFVHVTYGSEDEPIHIEADVRCAGATLEQAQQRADGSAVVARYNDDGILRVEPAFPERILKRDGASLQIRLPASRIVRVKTSNGEIIIKGTRGAAAESVEARTSNAPVHVQAVRGMTTVHTSNGNVIASDIEGLLMVDTSNASIRVSDIDGELRLDTSNGSIAIELQDQQAGPIRADTSNASIHVSLGAGFVGRIDCDTSNARVRFNDHGDRITEKKIRKSDGYVVVGSDAITSRLDTSNARIVVDIE